MTLKDQITSIISAVSGGSDDTTELVEAVSTELGEMDEGIASTVLKDPDLRSQFMTRVQGDLTRKQEAAAQVEASQARAAREAAQQQVEKEKFEAQRAQADVSVSPGLFIPEQLRKLIHK